MFAACIANNNKKRRMNEKLNHPGIDVGKRKCRAALKDVKGKILDEFFLVMMQTGLAIYFLE